MNFVLKFFSICLDISMVNYQLTNDSEFSKIFLRYHLDYLMGLNGFQSFLIPAHKIIKKPIMEVAVLMRCSDHHLSLKVPQSVGILSS